MSELGDAYGLAMKIILAAVIVVTAIVTASVTWLVMRDTPQSAQVQEVSQ
jgi:hypothetical protein